MFQFRKKSFIFLFVSLMFLFGKSNASYPYYFKNYQNVPPYFQTKNLSESIRTKIVEFVTETVGNLSYSIYKMGGSKFDTAKGIYIVDCSSYVDHILEEVTPNAYTSLVNRTGSYQPNSRNYYEFFKKLSNTPDQFWNKVKDVRDLQPGDILVFRYQPSRRSHERGGHVMVVMNKPVRDYDAFMVRVADSAPLGHTKDTRESIYSGIGIGTLLLKINAKTGQPMAYAWRVGSSWKKNVNFAMGRPMDINVG